MAKAYAELPDIKPQIKQFLVNSSGNDAAQQIAQIENMIAAGADAIIINAASPTALDPVVQKAQKAGIVVVAFDNIVETKGVVIVNEDQVEFGRVMADWLVKEGADAAVLAALDSIAWTFNVRGTDVTHTPVGLAFALVNADGTADLFVEGEKVGDDVRAHLGNGVRRPSDVAMRFFEVM